MGGGERDYSLEVTPTWAVALVCSVFIAASFAVERAIHYFGQWLRKREERSRSKPLVQALEKTKEELMVLGFLSILLAAFQEFVTKICREPARHMLPCKQVFHEVHSDDCPEGKVPFVSKQTLHKLHFFIFVLAIVHVVYSCLTLLLGRFKVHTWHAWELSCQSEAAGGALNRQGTFSRKHADPRWISSQTLSWIVCFLRQFTMSVSKTDYKALRLGFLQKHNLRSTFDFHRYILRVLEDDYQEVVGISAPLWVFVIIFLLLNIEGWNTYFWISFLPLALLTVLGAKLQHIIMSLAVDAATQQQDDGSVITASLRDDLFWFRSPKLILHLLHFILFQNAFELAFFFWIWKSLGFTSCVMERMSFVITRLVIGVMVQILCSYSTLPLYALVTQMGSHYKAPIFNEHVQTALTSWHAKAKDRVKHHHDRTGTTVVE